MDLPEAVTVGKKPTYKLVMFYRWGGCSGRPFHFYSITLCIVEGGVDDKANCEHIG